MNLVLIRRKLSFINLQLSRFCLHRLLDVELMISRGQDKITAPRQAVQWQGYVTDYLMWPEQQHACQLLYTAALGPARRPAAAFCSALASLSAAEEVALPSRAGRLTACTSQAVQPCRLL